MAMIIDELMQSPHLPRYLERLQAAFADEQGRRRQFYDTMSEQEKVEFINGEVVVQSPAKWEHTDASDNLLILLKTYAQRHGLGFVGHEKMLISLTRNDYEPDICYFSQEKAAGFQPGQMQFPAPDLIVEVLSPSTEARDRGVKFEDYAAHGVAEYWLIDPPARTVEQYLLEGEVYQLQIKARSGEIAARALPGFTIPIVAIFDRAAHLAALQAILAG